MSDLNDAVAELERLKKLLREETPRLEQAARKAVDAEADYKVGYARAFLGAEGPVAEREAKATVDTDDLFRAKRLNEELLRVQRQRISAIESAIEITRSLNATARDLDRIA